MKQLILLIILFTFCLCSRHRKEYDIQKSLFKNSFNEFKTYFDTLTGGQSNDFIKGQFTRDLFENYKEGVFYCTHLVTSDKEYPKQYLEHFNLQIIYNADEIIQYKLEVTKSVNSNNVTFAVIDTSYNHRDNILMRKLKSKYSQKYLSELKEEDLLNFSLVYGDACGYSGNSPECKIFIDSLVKINDKKSLLKWLISINTEKQIYALDGYNQLKKNGTILDNNESEYIKLVLSKKGSINVCDGCDISRKEISKVVTKFKL